MKWSVRSFTAAIVVTATLLYSCKSATTEELIIGKWAFDKWEKDGAKTSDEETHQMEEKAKGNWVSFEKFGIFKSVDKEKTDNGHYQLLNNGETLVTRMDKDAVDDTLKILELTSSVLKLKADRDIITLKKIK